MGEGATIVFFNEKAKAKVMAAVEAVAKIHWGEELEKDPGNLKANCELGALFMRLKRYSEAEPFLRKAVF